MEATTAISFSTMDIKDFEKIFKNYYGALCQTAYKITNSTDTAEDVVQDLFMHLWNNRESINIQSSLSSYLLISVRNRAIRNMQKQKAKVVEIGEKHENTFSADTATDDDVQSVELAAQIKEAIDTLPPKCKEVFLLSRYENKKYKEIAEICDISIKTVENQMGKALKMIKEHLQQHYKGNLSLWLLFFLIKNRGISRKMYLFL